MSAVARLAAQMATRAVAAVQDGVPWRTAQAPLLAALALGLGACGTGREPLSEPTIASLAAAPQAEAEAPPAPSPAEARRRAAEAYRELLAAPPRAQDGAADAEPAISAAVSSPVAGELRRRLADLQLELAADVVEAEGEGGVDGSEAAGYAAAIELYRELLANDAGDDSVAGAERRLAIRYQLARALALAGRGDAARSELDALDAAYGAAGSAVAGMDEVQFRRGEMHFAADDYPRAASAYGAVLEFGTGSIYYARALYMRGWSRFKNEQFRGARADFSALLARRLGSEPNADDGDGNDNDKAAALAALPRADRELLDDALRAMALSFAYQSGDPGASAAAANAHFAADPQPWEDLFYASLATQALDKRQFAEAAAANGAFVARHPHSRRAPFFQAQRVAAWEAAGLDDEALQARREFVELHAAQATAWGFAATGDDRGAEVEALLERYLRELAGHHHAQAQRFDESGDGAAAVAQRGAAIDWYRRYLAAFADDERAAQMSFLLAEVLFEQGEYRDAVGEYQRVAYDTPDFPRSEEAGYAALLAFDAEQQRLPALPERAVAGAEGGEPGAAGEAVRWRLAGIDSALRFAERYRSHPQRGAALLRAAQDLYRFGEDQRAQRIAGELLAEGVVGELRVAALRVSANVDFAASRYAAAETGYAELYATQAEDDAQRGEVGELLATSIYRQGEAAREAGELRAAAVHFRRAAAVQPGTPLALAAEYDAAALLYLAADALDGDGESDATRAAWGEAAAALADFRDSHPEHPLAAEAGRKLALAYQRAGDAAAAAAEFHRLAREDDDPELRDAALREAAGLYETEGEVDAATALYTELLQRSGDDFDAALVLHGKLLDLSLAAGDAAALRRWRQSLLDLDARAAAAGARSEGLRQGAAEAALALARPSLAAFHATPLTAPIERSLPQKQQRLEAALAAYARAAGYGLLPVASEAAYRIGELYRGFARALLQSQRPAGLSELQLEQYEILLEEQAFPFEEEAIAAHEVNAARLPDGVWDRWTRASLVELAELSPGQYRKSERGAKHVESLD